MNHCLFTGCHNAAIYTAPNAERDVPIACREHRYDVVEFNVHYVLINESLLHPMSYYFNDINCIQKQSVILPDGIHLAILWLSNNVYVHAHANPGIAEVYNVVTINGTHASIKTYNDKKKLILSECKTL
jgi:hypothetical protein